LINKIRQAIRLYKDNEARLKEAQSYYEAIGYLCNLNKLSGNPALHIGTALQLAKLYGMTFGIGTSYSQCRVGLPRNRWQNPLDENVNQFHYGVFYQKPSNQIDSIYAYHNRLELAICRCLMFAKIAKVII